MKTTQHTPGPWEAEQACLEHETEVGYFKAPPHWQVKASQKHGCELICRTPQYGPNLEANAQFIVTACNAFYSQKQALVDIALLCENETDKTDWQEVLRIANKGLASSNEPITI